MLGGYADPHPQHGEGRCDCRDGGVVLPLDPDTCTSHPFLKIEIVDNLY